MNKLFLLIFSTVFSLMCLFLTYYGITRYIQLYIFKDSKTYINRYQMKKKNKNPKVVISLTNLDNENKNLRPMINSLLDQTSKVDQICINIYPNKDETQTI